MRVEAVGWRSYYLAYDYGRNIFKTLAPDAILFMDGGDDTFYSTAYLQFAEGKRKDVELHDRGGLVFKSLYGPDFRMITQPEKEERRREVEKQFLSIRPVYFSTFNKEVMPGIKLVPDGFLYTPILNNASPLYSQRGGRGAFAVTENSPNPSLRKRGGNSVKPNSYFAYAVRNVYDRQSADYRSRALAPIYPYFAAFYDASNSGQYQRYTFLAWPDVMWLEGNLKIEMLTKAYEDYSKNRFPEAALDYENLLKYFPNDYDTTINLGVVNEKMHKLDKAIECYNKAATLNPEKTDPYYNIAVIYWQKADWENVVRNLNQMLQMNPNEPRAQHYLPMAQHNLMSKSKHKIQN
jgi:tetratricopeptide (TPR) repeat protein